MFRRPLIVFLVIVAPSLAQAPSDVHRQVLDLAARQEGERRDRFAAVKTKTELDALQKSLRDKFLGLLDCLPHVQGAPPAKILGTIEADDHVIHKLVFESFPGYFVSALLYKPKKIAGRLPAVISPCGHSPVGKAAGTYQILHVNLVKRGYIVLTYDPVGQGERSQFWDRTAAKSKFNLVCGEHAVLGNPLYLLGTSLARYRIHDGIRALDYLASLPEVDVNRLGCVGNSGGGTLTAYIAALDPRVKAAAICCYITTLPRRMGNRIERDPDADPEQDIYGFVAEGIDHAGLLALRVPRPTMVGAAQLDFFPIEGARESFKEATHLFEVAGVGDKVVKVESPEKHGLSLPLRQGVYKHFQQWLAQRDDRGEEIPVQPRAAKDLYVCAEEQVNVTFQSRHLFDVALEHFATRAKTPRRSLAAVLGLDEKGTTFGLEEIGAGQKSDTTIVLINGNESPPWQQEKDFLATLTKTKHRVIVVEPRGIGSLRSNLTVRGHDYADPLVGVEENIAYNAFLTGKNLLGMRVSDVLAAVGKLPRGERIVLCARRDAALIATMTAAVRPDVSHLAVEDMPLSYRHFFHASGRPINAASIVPNLLRDHGDIGDVLASIAPRRVLVSAAVGEGRLPPSARSEAKPWSASPRLLVDWLGD